MSRNYKPIVVGCVLAAFIVSARGVSSMTSPEHAPGVSPVAIAAHGDAHETIVLGAEGMLLFVGADGEVCRSLALGTPVTGMALRGDTAYVTTEAPDGEALVVDLGGGAVVRRYRVGHTPMSPKLSEDGQTLYVANRFDSTVAMLDLGTGEQRIVQVIREPVVLALSEDGAKLFVANLLPEVRPFLDDENPYIAAQVSVVDTESGRVLKHIDLPNGSQSLRGMALSPDGRHVVVTHLLGNYTVPTIGLEGGAMNRSAISLIDTEHLYCAATVVLDEADRGAANPWGVAFVPGTRGEQAGDSSVQLVVTHAGTHELSVIDWPKLLARIADRGAPGDYFGASVFTMLDGIRKRIPLPLNGPRAVVTQGNTIYVAGYFSENLVALDLSVQEGAPSMRAIDLANPQSAPSASLARIGEQYFHDASDCLQTWQSCASCHPDGRSDVLYWDLLNDGVGNTKNTKSLLMAMETPPVMWRGVRAHGGVAVRAGIKYIQFATPEPGQADAIEAYLTGLKATPSPYLNADELEPPKVEEAACAKCHYPGVRRGVLTEAARRGKALFEGKAGCVACHPHPYFTTMKSVDPGLGNGVLYDVPSLVGAWRTAPYLHSGDALTIEETITDFNHAQQRGNTDDLTDTELADLIAYVRSL